jgi:hypothetical protein
VNTYCECRAIVGIGNEFGVISSVALANNEAAGGSSPHGITDTQMVSLSSVFRTPCVYLSLPKTRFVRTGDVIRPRLHGRRCFRSARSGARPAHPFRVKHEDAIVINGEFRKDSPKVLLVEHDQMIGTLAPDRPDQALNMAVLPGRAE